MKNNYSENLTMNGVSQRLYVKGVIAGAETSWIGRKPSFPTLTQKPPPVDHCIVGGAHAFILRVSSYVGLAPLKFESRANGFSVTISNAMCMYSYSLVTILAICSIVGTIAEINVGVELSTKMSTHVSQVVFTCDMIIVVATAGAGVYGAPERMRTMIHIMKTIASVDNSIGAKFSVMAERKLCALLVAIMITLSLLLAGDLCFFAVQARRFDRQWNVVLNYIWFYLLWYVVLVLELQFAFTALSVWKRFQAVNDTLALTAKHAFMPLEKPKKSSPLNIYAIRVVPEDNSSQRTANVSHLVDSSGSTRDQNVVIIQSVRGSSHLAVTPCEAIRQLASLHGQLCEVVRRINDSYGLPVVLILTATLIHLIITPYFLITEIIVSKEHENVHFLILEFLWCALHMMRLLVLVETSYYTIAEGRRTENLVCRLMNSAPSTGMLPSRLELFSRQLLMQSVSYSPMGICQLDRPLVPSVLGAVTTYLVILMQFQIYDNQTSFS